MGKETLPVQKNEQYVVEISDLTHEGAGVAKIDGYPIFVPDVLVGEKIEMKVIKVGKSFGFGRLVEILEPSPDRVTPPCSIYKWCGGCQLQHLSYEGQMKSKYRQVRELITRMAGLPDVPVHQVLGMEEPWYYRNKSQVPVGVQNGQWVAGFYKKRSHDIIDMDTCWIQEKENDKIIQYLKELCQQYEVAPYEEETHKGVLRHFMVRYGKKTGEVMVVFVTRTQEFPNRKAIIEKLVERFPSVVSIVQNMNNKRTNVIFGDETKTLWGKPFIIDFIGDVKFEISARSFFQVNPVQTEVLYGKALEYAELTGDETVIDAYCGIGTISLFLAKKAKMVYGVEIVPQAIEDARRNAEINEFDNTHFEAGPAEEVIPRWYKEGIKADVLMVDPPRKGCDEKLLQTITAMKPKKVVYVSCNPATLARDLKYLETHGYRTTQVQPVDMFPQTTHCEAVAKLVLNPKY